MAQYSISGSKILNLEHPISALEDQPALSADDLKAYFDANPQQLCDAHNNLIEGLTTTGAAAELGFSPTDSITAYNVQEAVETVQAQLLDIALENVPDGSITTAKLDSEIRAQLNLLSSLATTVSTLQETVQRIRPSGAQFPLMVLALSDNCPDEITDEIATAAFGAHFAAEVYDLGIQLAWLCRWKNSTLPSETFRQKQTINEIFDDATTLYEIETLTPVRSLISLSAEISSAYHIAMDNAEQ